MPLASRQSWSRSGASMLNRRMRTPATSSRSPSTTCARPVTGSRRCAPRRYGARSTPARRKSRARPQWTSSGARLASQIETYCSRAGSRANTRTICAPPAIAARHAAGKRAVRMIPPVRTEEPPMRTERLRRARDRRRRVADGSSRRPACARAPRREGVSPADVVEGLGAHRQAARRDQSRQFRVLAREVRASGELGGVSVELVRELGKRIGRASRAIHEFRAARKSSARRWRARRAGASRVASRSSPSARRGRSRRSRRPYVVVDRRLHGEERIRR